MLQDLHIAIQRLILERGQIPADEVDVRFDRPSREWVDSLTRPTISLYLFDVQENTDLRQTNMSSTRVNGRAQYRMPPRRFDLRYMVSALSSVAEDEHLLLWRTLTTLLRYPDYPLELLPEALLTLEPRPSAQVSKTDDGPNLLDVWSGLDLPPRPALLYIVTAPIDLEITFESPLVLTRTTRVMRPALAEERVGAPLRRSSAVLIGDNITIGGTVRNKQGEPLAGVAVAIAGSAAASVTNDEGRFILSNVPSGKITLQVTKDDGAPQSVAVVVPSDSYDIVID